VNSSARLQRRRTGRRGGTGEAGGLDGGFGGVFAAETATEVRHHHPHPAPFQSERAGQFAHVTERGLGAGPDREPAVLPFGQGGARFHGRVLHVGNFVLGFQRARSRGDLRGEGVRRHATLDPLPENPVDLRAGGMRGGFPARGRGECFDRLFGLEQRGGGHADEIAVADHDHARQRLRRGGIDPDQAGAVGGGTEDLAAEHSRTGEVRGIPVGTGDEVAAVRTRKRGAEDAPFRHRSDRDVRGGGLMEGGLGFVAAGQFREGEPALAGRVGEDTVPDFDGGGVDFPTPGGQAGQDSARGGGGLADGGDGGGRGAAAGGGSVVGDRGGVGHQESDVLRGDAEFLGGGLGEFGAGALAHFHLAGEDGDRAVLGQVEAGGDRRVGGPPAAAGGAVLGDGIQDGDADEEAGAEGLEEAAAGPVRLAAGGGLEGEREVEVEVHRDRPVLGIRGRRRRGRREGVHRDGGVVPVRVSRARRTARRIRG
jgi:hypothetical protein